MENVGKRVLLLGCSCGATLNAVRFNTIVIKEAGEDILKELRLVYGSSLDEIEAIEAVVVEPCSNCSEKK